MYWPDYARVLSLFSWFIIMEFGVPSVRSTSFTLIIGMPLQFLLKPHPHGLFAISVQFVIATKSAFGLLHPPSSKWGGQMFKGGTMFVRSAYLSSWALPRMYHASKSLDRRLMMYCSAIFTAALCCAMCISVLSRFLQPPSQWYQVSACLCFKCF